MLSTTLDALHSTILTTECLLPSERNLKRSTWSSQLCPRNDLPLRYAGLNGQSIRAASPLLHHGSIQ